MIVEVMGRYTGWIALKAGIASGADIILIPELPFKTDRVCDAINERINSGRNSTIIVVAEGAKLEGGDITVRMVVSDSHDPIRLGGIGDRLANEITEKTNLEARVTVLGHIQRGGTPSAFDRILATRFGAAAVDVLASGTFGRMVCLHSTRIESVVLDDAVKQLKKVPPDGDVVRAARSIGISFGQ
jgi:6-phosphofructokinase 1